MLRRQTTPFLLKLNCKETAMSEVTAEASKTIHASPA